VIEVKRRLVLFGLTLSSAACSLFLDFDLTGNQPAATPDGGPPVAPNNEGGGPPSDAGDDDVTYPPEFGELLCGPTQDVCDGFEDRATPVGGPIFTRSLGEGVGFTTKRPASDKQSLEVVRPQVAGQDDAFLLAENGPFTNGKGRVLLQVFIAILRPQDFNIERTVVSIRPFPTIDAIGAPGVRVVVRPTGIFVEMREFSKGSPNLIVPLDAAKFADRRYHALQIHAHFTEPNQVHVALDGDFLLPEDSGVVLSDVSNPIGSGYTIGLGASTKIGGGALTTRFDNVRIRHD
jgi:hypothetical protein